MNERKELTMIDPRYDTQLLIEGHDLDEDEIRDYFLENLKGDCLLAVGDDELIKIHLISWWRIWTVSPGVCRAETGERRQSD